MSIYKSMNTYIQITYKLFNMQIYDREAKSFSQEINNCECGKYIYHYKFLYIASEFDDWESKCLYDH